MISLVFKQICYYLVQGKWHIYYLYVYVKKSKLFPKFEVSYGVRHLTETGEKEPSDDAAVEPFI